MRPTFALGFLLVLACNVQPDRRTATLVAVYEGGEITAAELTSWLHYKGRSEDSASRDDLETIAMTEVLAGSAAGRISQPPLLWQLEKAERGLLVGALRRHLATTMEIPEDRIESHLPQDGSAVVRPKKVRLRNLFKRLPQNMDAGAWADARERLEAIRGQVQNGADFGRLAALESDSETRFRQGRMGLVGPGDLPSELEDVVFALEAGQVSDVVEVEGGLALFYCDQIRAARQLSAAEARDRVESVLSHREGKRRWAALREELLATTQLEIDLAALRNRSATAAQPVARLGDRHLGLGEFHFLLEGAGLGEPSGLDESRLRQAIERWAFQVLATKRARALGLADEDLLQRQRWKRAELAAADEVRRQVEVQIEEPTRGRIEEHFEDERERYFHPARYRLAVIQWPGNGAGGERLAQMRRANEVVSAVRRGERSFADTAREISRHPSAASGGTLQWLTRRQLSTFGPSVFGSVTALQPGQIIEPVQQDDDIWIAQLLDVDSRRPKNLEEASDEIAKRLADRQRQDLRVELAQNLRREIHLERLDDESATDL